MIIQSPALAIVAGALVAVSLVFAYLIGVGKKMNLISGWDPKNVADADGYARVYGLALVISAVPMLAVALLVGLGGIGQVQLVVAVVLTSVPVLVGAAYANRKYGRRSGSGDQANG